MEIFREKNKTSVTASDCKRKKKPHSRPRPENTGADMQPIAADYPLNDSCLDQSDCSKLGQTTFLAATPRERECVRLFLYASSRTNTNVK